MKLHRMLCATVTVSLLFVACKGGAKGEASGPSPEELEALKAECARIMPKTFAGVWVGMTEEDLKAERPEAAYQPQRTDPLEHRWYQETSPTGVKVWYGIDRDTGRLGVVQFAHMFDSWGTFSSHATALLDRFGTEHELYTCPAGASAPTDVAMTRLLWPRQPVAVMEAVLEVGDSVSVTMIVAPVEECRKGIEKQRCVRLDKDKALETWIDEQLDEQIEKREKSAKHGHGVTPPGPGGPQDHQDPHDPPGDDGPAADPPPQPQ